MSSPRLYSYCIPVDDGAAPNPYWGVCTLAICKPRIRATATAGDWIAGTGAKFARLGDGGSKDMSGKLVFAMRVTQKVTMAEYDALTRRELPHKIPTRLGRGPSRIGQCFGAGRGRPTDLLATAERRTGAPRIVAPRKTVRRVVQVVGMTNPLRLEGA
ncbi:MAG: hypothetical protein ABSF69_29000 [Polyangiaceae bacterium]